jgi:acyl-homoserine-lactone acylase
MTMKTSSSATRAHGPMAVRWAWALAAAIGLLCCLSAQAGAPAADGVEILRTTDGIPHVRANSWRELGRGAGYAQAEDALCTLAEAFVTFEGRRSYFFGPEAVPAMDSTFGRRRNVELDFFFRAFVGDDVVAAFRAAQPAELNELIEGFAAGYNRYLRDERQAGGRSRHACLHEPWMREIGAKDLVRRLHAATLGAGQARFAAELARAQPPSARAERTSWVDDGLRDRLALPIGDQPGFGSNAIAFGARATGGDGGVLLGNPHWYWGGPDRFYQMHLTIPGQLNVAGAAFLGVPLVMIGFNEHVAWSHTVSTARRFGLFELTLDRANPTRYRVDGRTEAMHKRELSVELRGPDGRTRTLKRTLYSSRFGPVVDLGASDPAFAWGPERALALRDVNAENFRVFRNFFEWNRAKSLDEFVEIQRREAAVPWVNTLAIGRDDRRAWYADLGAVPNVPDDLREHCATQLSRGFAQLDPITPVLDGSRSGCDWRNDQAAAQRGAMPATALPQLLREDYVANMNDSHWLANPAAPLEGHTLVLGGERQALSLRSRLGHRIAQELLVARLPSSQALSERLRQAALQPRAYSAVLFKDDLLGAACRTPEVPLGEGAAAVRVDITPACRVLQRWPGTAEAHDRGALLWDSFWTYVEQIPAAQLYRAPFDAARPLATPARPGADEARIAQALARAVQDFHREGKALDAALGNRRSVSSGGQRVPLFGGCPMAGHFVVACNRDGSDAMGPLSMGNSYLQVVSFGANGPEAYTLLAHGQRDGAVAGGQGDEPVLRYAHKAWLRFPFSEAEIAAAADPALTRRVLSP